MKKNIKQHNIVNPDSIIHTGDIEKNNKKEWKKPELTIIGFKATDFNDGSGDDGGYTGANAVSV